MGWFEGILLGIIQGLTEFLPVSSSGHLTIVSYFLNAKDAGLTFDILLHFATLISVIICYRKDLWELIKHPFQKYVGLIIIASIPAGIAGVFFGGVGLYRYLADFAGAGATVPLTGFGYSLSKGVKQAVDEQGFLGIFTGGLTATAGGIAAAIVFGWIAGLVCRPKDK